VVILEQEYGFVIRQFWPQRQKVVLLCSVLGKISITINNPKICSRLCVGMFISFIPQIQPSKGYFADCVQIQSTPLGFFYPDIVWLHRIAEFLYYFLSLDNPCPEIFTHFVNCKKLINRKLDFGHGYDAMKRIFFLYFFFITGQTPCLDKNKKKLVDTLNFLDVDFENEQKVEFLIETAKSFNKKQIKEIDDIVAECLKAHPCFTEFKTVKIAA
jgi:hypothetical protein